MCIFSGPVKEVAGTKIFARLSGRGTQFLVYSMRYAAERPVAMILPLPVALPGARNGVRFINLQSYPRFFKDMARGFPEMGGGGFGGGGYAASAGSLPVEEVGDFIASFVPRLEDFRRLDPRFVLPSPVWGKIPEYKDYGFAVFQLKAQPATAEVHPMAFEFPTRAPQDLFFPTVHIHDGRVHAREEFDHALYFQDARLNHERGKFDVHVSLLTPERTGVTMSYSEASRFLQIANTQGVVAPDQRVYRQTLMGQFPNRDTVIRCGWIGDNAGRR